MPAAAHVARTAHRAHRGKHTSVRLEVLVLIRLGWWPAVYSSVLAERVVAHVKVLLLRMPVRMWRTWASSRVTCKM